MFFADVRLDERPSARPSTRRRAAGPPATQLPDQLACLYGWLGGELPAGMDTRRFSASPHHQSEEELQRNARARA